MSSHELPDDMPCASSSNTVLIADDDSSTRVLVRAALEPDGWAVQEAENGLQVCNAIDQINPDIVVLDVNMPELDGIETCARLRLVRAGRHVPVLMITVKDDPDAIRRAYDAGATDFLTKPFDFTVLRHRLQYMHRSQQMSRELRNERDFVSAVVDHSAALVMILDPTGRIIRFNERCSCASGFALEDVRDKHVWDVLAEPSERETERGAFNRLIAARGTSHDENVWIGQDGRRREIAWFNSVLENEEGEVEHVVCTGLDITEQNHTQDRLRHLTSFDQLTGLPNRRRVSERLNETLATAQDSHQVGVLILDLDRFKDLNATLGRAPGDELLIETADRLAKSLRLSDAVMEYDRHSQSDLGRLGADEFSVIVPKVQDAEALVKVVERLQHALVRPLRIQNHELAITASVGAAMYPRDGQTSEALLRNAEAALEGARQKTRGSYHFYSSTMSSAIAERVTLESELRTAVERNQLELHYQPKMSTSSGRIVGAEALMRWQHPSRGLLSPGTFIDLAEESGLIASIGKWVLREACSQVTSWLDSGQTAVPVAVNLSSAQFHMSDVLESIVWVLNETSLDPRYLAVEITETMIMEDADKAHDVLRRLGDLGVQTAIDDFGTGYSTLSSLKTLPVHHLKIDRAFIKNLADDPQDVAITRAIVELAHGLNLSVIAEGVESEQQLNVLRELRCDEVQGFLIGRPIPSDQFSQFVAEAEAHGADPTRQAQAPASDVSHSSSVHDSHPVES